MTKDEIAELRRAADVVVEWLDQGILPSLPLEYDIRALARLALKAVRVIESTPTRRSWLFDDGRNES